MVFKEFLVEEMKDGDGCYFGFLKFYFVYRII